MPKAIKAKYENGVLKPLKRVDLKEGQGYHLSGALHREHITLPALAASSRGCRVSFHATVAHIQLRESTGLQQRLISLSYPLPTLKWNLNHK